MAYLGAGLAQLGVLPTMDTIVLERFFDDAGGMQLVGHAPFGARLNRALGLALRKRFCVTFDFELQAAASDDAILLSLGPQHSFPLDRVPKFLASGTVEEVVRQAVLTSPMFAARWRWNLNTSLAVLRMRGGRKNPPAIQRMEADDLMAAVVPDAGRLPGERRARPAGDPGPPPGPADAGGLPARGDGHRRAEGPGRRDRVRPRRRRRPWTPPSHRCSRTRS